MRLKYYRSRTWSLSMIQTTLKGKSAMPFSREAVETSLSKLFAWGYHHICKVGSYGPNPLTMAEVWNAASHGDVYVRILLLVMLVSSLHLLWEFWIWANPPSPPPTHHPFYQRPPSAFQTCEELFDGILPIIYAFNRPRRHGYQISFDLTALIVHK